jgi:RNA-directed DNA polymerase
MFSPRAEALAAAFLSSETWTQEALVPCGAAAFGLPRKRRWLAEAAKRAVEMFPRAPRSQFRELVRLIDGILAGRRDVPAPRRVPVPVVGMGSTPWSVPALDTTGDLARWLDLSVAELMWFADPRGLERLPAGAEALRHYRYSWVSKPSGGVRLLEAPKPRMKRLGRRILHELLDRVPAHDAAHGFRAGRSVVTHASNHTGTSIVVRIDLADFFLSVRAAQVRAIFAAMGYPSEVAWLLTALTTNIAPSHGPPPPPGTSPDFIRSLRRVEMLARTRHLPQGAPTSPALANLAAYGLDVRLTAAAHAAAARYSRYADDLVFSGDASFARSAMRFVRLVEKIARDEGFIVNRAKTRLLRVGARQTVTGVVVNERPTLARAEAKLLEAILYNCVRHGPASQNRDGHADFRAHLQGRVAHVQGIDAKRADRVVQLFWSIRWE